MRISDWSSDVCSSDLEIAAASASWSDDAAATLFAAGIAARFAAPGLSALWALTRFDLYAPGLEQAGLGPDRILYAQGSNDRELLAMRSEEHTSELQSLMRISYAVFCLKKKKKRKKNK